MMITPQTCGEFIGLSISLNQTSDKSVTSFKVDCSLENHFSSILKILQFGDDDGSNELLFAEIPILDDSKCANYESKYKADMMICAGFYEVCTSIVVALILKVTVLEVAQTETAQVKYTFVIRKLKKSVHSPPINVNSFYGRL